MTKTRSYDRSSRRSRSAACRSWATLPPLRRLHHPRPATPSRPSTASWRAARDDRHRRRRRRAPHRRARRSCPPRARCSATRGPCPNCPKAWRSSPVARRRRWRRCLSKPSTVPLTSWKWRLYRRPSPVPRRVAPVRLPALYRSSRRYWPLIGPAKPTSCPCPVAVRAARASTRRKDFSTTVSHQFRRLLSFLRLLLLLPCPRPTHCRPARSAPLTAPVTTTFLAIFLFFFSILVRIFFKCLISCELRTIYWSPYQRRSVTNVVIFFFSFLFDVSVCDFNILKKPELVYIYTL